MTRLGWTAEPGGTLLDPADWPPAVLRLARRASLSPVAGTPDLVLCATAGDGQRLRYLPDARRVSDETYLLRVTAGPPRQVEIVHGGPRGLRWALNEVLRTAPDVPADGRLRHPAFPVRGVIEGFYGPPWTHRQRLDLLAFLADHNLNAYCYAPKADPYLRTRWRQPHPAPELARLGELVAAAAQDEVEFWYGISPGLSIRYAEPADLDTLLSKLEQVYQLGVRRFGLLLDDIPDELQHPVDRATFPDLVTAHAYLAGEVHRRLRERDPAISLAVCPTVYCGTGDEYYPSRLGTAIDPRIGLFWTGRAVCSPTLDAGDAATFARATLRPAAATVTLLAAAGCGSGGSDDDGVTLRVAMGSPGEALIATWEAAKQQYEADHPDVTVELNFQDDDLYQTAGLPNLLNGRNAPDIYFEWAGERLRQRQAEGHAADLTEALADSGLADRFPDGAFKQMRFDGGTYMVPGNADVTNVMWYNTAIFDQHRITPPQTWADLLAACDTLQAAGITPIASGNKDLWAAGNWIGHLVARAAGADTYAAALRHEVPLDNPGFVAGMEYAAELVDHGCVNDSVNAINDNEGAQLFFRGAAAMHPIGSWLVTWALDEAPDLEFDYFNLPAVPDGDGDQASVIGVATGYVVNAESDHLAEAVDFLAVYSSPEITAQVVEAGGVPMTVDPFAGAEVDERLQRLADLLTGAPELVAPPDTGYDIANATAFYEAVAEVLGGRSEPAEALAAADGRIG